MNSATVQSRVEAIAEVFAAQRPTRQLRRSLDQDDFRRLAEAGFTALGAPVSMGGLWQDIPTSTRMACNLVRTIAKGDPSVALVSAMHPAVASFWQCQPEPPAQFADAWAAQQRFVAQSSLDGNWWGTITSEPGSGGDVSKTKSITVRGPDGTLLLSGQKHFGSGSGATSFVITTALPPGESTADWFFLDIRNAVWDGSTGMKLVAEWDGHGMVGTQSHAFEFSGYPATRIALEGDLTGISSHCSAFIASLFTSVVVGVTQAAFEKAREQIRRRQDALNAYERTEWTRAENEMWLIEAAAENALRAVEAHGAAAGLDTLRAKTVIAELAESLTGRICRIIGGGTFHRGSHFGAAFEDVRALGFLRPPWGLAYETIWERSTQTP